jgi:hypothetical protein
MAEQVFYKGSFKGLFEKNDPKHSDKIVFSKIHWTYLNIDNVSKIGNFNVEENKTADFWFAEKIANKSSFNLFKKDRVIFIPRLEDLAYSDDIFNVLIKNIKFNFANTDFASNWFEASGDIYFQTQIARDVVKEKVVDNKKIEEQITQVGGEGILTNTSGSVGVDAAAGTESDNNGCWPLNRGSQISINDPLANSQNSNWTNIIGTILWIILLIYAYTHSKPIFYFLLAVSILWGITRFFFKNILGRIFTFILIIVLAFYALSYVFKKGKEIIPDQTKKGSIKVNPPREGDKKPGSNEKDLLSDKSINWYDFSSSNYQANYSTSTLSFLSTQEKHQALVSSINANNSVDYFNQVYQGLNNCDSKKVDMLVDVFKDSAKRMHLNSLQLAEMVTTFVQEIPYVLVHDGTCSDASKAGGFVREWHQDSKPCLANIPAGVQSPYEFIHNLKGDCDTRTLLAFTILKKLKIPASIWVSEAYGHSILGIGLPFASGFHKAVAGVNHYSAELTSKCRIGFVSPDQNEESNWDIAIYYQP